MSGINYLKLFDKRQLFRFFVDGRFHKKYDGWVGYEAGERGSVKALLGGLSFILENFDISDGISSHYLVKLHKVCMLGVETKNLKSSPGDLRYLNAGMPFLAKSTTYQNIVEVLDIRRDDGTVIFNAKKYAKTANEFAAEELYLSLLKEKRINYRNWYPNLDEVSLAALAGEGTLQEFYTVKNYVQMLFAQKMEKIVNHFNANIGTAYSEDDKLILFSKVVRDLELLHPFSDGNCRTFACLLLNHLLLFYNFPPTILKDPNLDGECSYNEFVQEIKKGIECTLALIKGPETAVYGYSIVEMPLDKQNEFVEMAKDTILKIDNYRESYLTPEIIQRLTGGIWFNCSTYKLFTGVGDYNTYQAGNLYFCLNSEEWIKQGKSVSQELQHLFSMGGIKAFVIDEGSYIEGLEYPFLLVEDISKAYKIVAKAVREEVGCKTILVTGTEGKTGAKVQLYHLLNPQINTHATLNSANTEIPVLRSLINLQAEDQVEISEVSVGSIESLRVERAKIVQPDICLFTNIGPNHMDMHKSIDNIIVAKSAVVEGMRDDGFCVINHDMANYDALIQQINKRRDNVEIFTFGTKPDSSAKLINAKFDAIKNGWNVCASIEGDYLEYFLPLPQEHAPLMSVGLLLTVKKLGCDIFQAAAHYSEFVPFETMGRLITLHMDDGDVLFYDQSRRGAIEGMRSAFSDLKRLAPNRRIVALVGGVSTRKESAWTRKAHLELADLINESEINCLFTTGNYMNIVHEKLREPSLLHAHSDDIDYLAKALVEKLVGGDLLFVIGNAYLYLGRVADRILRSCEYSLLPINNENTGDVAKQILPAAEGSRIAMAYKAFHAGLTGEESSARYNLDIDRFNEVRKMYPTLQHYQGALLFDFITQVESYIVAEYDFVTVNETLRGQEGARVYDAEKCIRWFFNNTALVERGRHIFGSFFDFGSPDYLFHLNVGTFNLHVGLVAYKRTGEEIVLRKMHAHEFQSVIDRYSSQMSFDNRLEARAWGKGWCSIDCGNLIETQKEEICSTLDDFKKSLFFTQRLKPLLDGVKQYTSEQR